MKIRLLSMLGVILAVAACGSTPSDTSSLPSASAGEVASASTAISDEPSAAQEANASAGPGLPEYREVIIPNGTVLSMSLITPMGSDSSAVEDAVRAELTQAVTVDGREVLPAGAQVEGSVTAVDGAGRVTGLATIAFRLTSIQVEGERYELQAAPVSEMAPATKGEDAKKIGIGAGAGGLIGGLLGGADGAAKGAAVGGGAGVGVVLATKGVDVRLESGAAVITELTSPLTVRVLAD